MNETAMPKRELLINSAIRVFAEMGYHGSRVADVVKEAGVAHGLFYHYFPSKEDLLICIFQEAWMNMLSFIDKAAKSKDDPLENLRLAIRYMVKNFAVNSSLIKVLVLDVPRCAKFYEEENQELYRSAFTSLEKIVEEGKKRNVFNKNVTSSLASHLVYGAIDSIIRKYVYDPRFDPGKINQEEIVVQVTRMLLHGLCN